jgi:hypothetical protein
MSLATVAQQCVTAALIQSEVNIARGPTMTSVPSCTTVLNNGTSSISVYVKCNRQTWAGPQVFFAHATA